MISILKKNLRKAIVNFIIPAIFALSMPGMLYAVEQRHVYDTSPWSSDVFNPMSSSFFGDSDVDTSDDPIEIFYDTTDVCPGEDASTLARIWASSDTGLSSDKITNWTGAWSKVNTENARTYLSADINGDGLTDMIEIWLDQRSSDPQDNARATIWQKTDDDYYGLSVSNVGGWSSPGSSTARSYLSGDVNGDGLDDVFEIWTPDNQTTNLTVWKSVGDRLEFYGIHSLGNWKKSNRPDSNRFITMDADQDGLVDIVAIEINSTSDGTNATLWQNSGLGFNQKSTSEIGPWTDLDTPDTRFYLSMDEDGDGLPDLLEFWNENSTTRISVWKGSGHGFSASKTYAMGHWINQTSDMAKGYLRLPKPLNASDDLLEIEEVTDTMPISHLKNPDR